MLTSCGYYTCDHDILNLEGGTCDHGMMNMQSGTCDHGMQTPQGSTCNHGNAESGGWYLRPRHAESGAWYLQQPRHATIEACQLRREHSPVRNSLFFSVLLRVLCDLLVVVSRSQWCFNGCIGNAVVTFISLSCCYVSWCQCESEFFKAVERGSFCTWLCSAQKFECPATHLRNMIILELISQIANANLWAGVMIHVRNCNCDCEFASCGS